MENESNISKGEWLLVGLVAVITDISQLILDLFAIGLIANRVIDAVFGFALAIYFQIRGISLANPKIALGLIASFIGEESGIGDFLPLWSLDILYTYKVTENNSNTSPKNAKPIKPENKAEPLIKNGVRRPENDEELGNIE